MFSCTYSNMAFALSMSLVRPFVKELNLFLSKKDNINGKICQIKKKEKL